MSPFQELHGTLMLTLCPHNAAACCLSGSLKGWETLTVLWPLSTQLRARGLGPRKKVGDVGDGRPLPEALLCGLPALGSHLVSPGLCSTSTLLTQDCRTLGPGCAQVRAL